MVVMWLFTHRGFYSVVQDWDDNDMVWVRARCAADLDALETGEQMKHTPGRDYPWRIRLSKEAFAELAGRLALEIDYSNFKGRIGEIDRDRAHAYSGVWSVMFNALDRFRHPASRRARSPRARRT